MRFAFVVSSPVHVQTFVPLQNALQRRGTHDFVWLSLEEWYRWGGGAALEQAGIEATTVPGLPDGERLVHLPLPRMYFELLVRARRELRAALAMSAPDLIVVCNDRGLIEKELIRQTRARGAATLLVLEGVLWRNELRRQGIRFQSSGSARERTVRIAKEALALALRTARRPELAPTYLGQGGCDAIAAPGHAQRRVLMERGVAPECIAVTGQPRFDGIGPPRDRRALRRSLGLPPEAKVVALFTSGFGTQKQELLQRLQEELVGVVARKVSDHGSAILAFKPHPRESIEPYARLLNGFPRTRILACSAHTALSISDLAIAPPSTIVVEAALTRTPLVIANLAGDSSIARDLGLTPDSLPEVMDFEGVIRRVDAALSTELEPMSYSYAHDLLFVPEGGAAVRVADLALSMVGR